MRPNSLGVVSLFLGRVDEFVRAEQCREGEERRKTGHIIYIVEVRHLVKAKWDLDNERKEETGEGLSHSKPSTLVVSYRSLVWNGECQGLYCGDSGWMQQSGGEGSGIPTVHQPHQHVHPGLTSPQDFSHSGRRNLRRMLSH